MARRRRSMYKLKRKLRKSYRRKYRRYRRKSKSEVKFHTQNTENVSFYGGWNNPPVHTLPPYAVQTIVATNNANRGRCNFFNNIEMGTSKHQRIGDSIRVKFISVKLSISLNYYPNTCVRIIFFTARFGTDFSTLEFFNLQCYNPSLQTARIDREKIHQILFDKTYQFNSTNYLGWNATAGTFDRMIGTDPSKVDNYMPMFHKRFKFRWNREVIYSGLTTATTHAQVKNEKDNIFFAIIGGCDSVSGSIPNANMAGHWNFSSRIYFTDN